MEKIKTQDVLRFIVLSLVGIFLYFIPIQGSKVPVVFLVNVIKTALGEYLKYAVLIVLFTLFVTIIGDRVFQNPFCKKLHEGESNAKLIHYSIAFFVVLAVWFKIPPANIFMDEKIGGQILPLSGTVMLTVSICGGFIVFILKSGIVEFIGGLMEPLMRPLFKLPGEAAVNYLSSYVVSAAVGVYMTDQYYMEKKYTKKEALTAATCFSTISVGYIAVLCSIGEVEHMYGTMLVLTFIMVFVMTIIMVRIPPLSTVKNVYIDEKPYEKKQTAKKQGSRFQMALERAAKKSQEFTWKSLLESMLHALRFSQKIIAYMIPIVIVTLTIVHLTPLFTYLGKPLAPILSLLGLPDAEMVAPAVLLGFIEVSLPAISVSGGVAAKSVCFVILLSIMQIIFMTEAGNAMLGAKFPFSFKDCILNFLIRSIVALPLVALVAHFIF